MLRCAAITRVAFFTAGKTGAGHFARGVAIARGLARNGVKASFRMFGPELPFAIPPRDDHEAIPIERAELSDPARAKESALARALVAWEPDVLLVDQYWAPLRFVLPIARCEAWLISHWIPDFWFTGPDAMVRWDATQYARMIAIEPYALHNGLERIDPIVIANPEELRPRHALREQFGVPDGAPLHVVAQAGRPGECDALVEATRARDPRAVVLSFSLFDQRALFPICEWLAGADRIACGAGYNAFWEAHWLGYWPRTDFTAFARAPTLSDQAWRMANVPLGTIPKSNGADALARAIASR